MKHPIRYAKSGDVHIAYQVVGEGPLDLVLVWGWISHPEEQWENPRIANFLNRLGSFARLILLDKRGTGLSDRVTISELPTLEQRMEDVHAVIDAAGAKSAALLGISEGGPMCALFAATYPERTRALILYGTYARWICEPQYPWAPTRETHEQSFVAYEQRWGSTIGLRARAPTLADDPVVREWWARHQRLSASPGAAIALYRMNIEIDIRFVLHTISVPALVLHRAQDKLIRVECGRFLAERIARAKYVELEGEDHLPWAGNADAVVDEIEEFLTGVRHGPQPDRVLATVLFTDIVGSTERAATLGDARWRELLERYHALARREVSRFRGKEMDTAGDGFFATFDGPARAVRCACAIREAVTSLGIEIRSGLHTGECEISGPKLTGIAVHIGARLASKAGAGEILASSTVRDLVAGSGLRFEDRGTHELKGVPGEWRLFAAEPRAVKAP
jgi:class 3 adenylate cyclase